VLIHAVRLQQVLRSVETDRGNLHRLPRSWLLSTATLAHRCRQREAFISLCDPGNPCLRPAPAGGVGGVNQGTGRDGPIGAAEWDGPIAAVRARGRRAFVATNIFSDRQAIDRGGPLGFVWLSRAPDRAPSAPLLPKDATRGTSVASARNTIKLSENAGARRTLRSGSPDRDRGEGR
jgi:hypothetical protein